MSEPRVTRVQRRMVHKVVEALNDSPVVVVAYAQFMGDMAHVRVRTVDDFEVIRRFTGETIEEVCIADGAEEVAKATLVDMDEDRRKEAPRWSVVFDRLGEIPGVDEVHGHLSKHGVGVCLSTNYDAKVSCMFGPQATAVGVYRRIVEVLHNEVPALTVMGSSVH